MPNWNCGPQGQNLDSLCHFVSRICLEFTGNTANCVWSFQESVIKCWNRHFILKLFRQNSRTRLKQKNTGKQQELHIRFPLLQHTCVSQSCLSLQIKFLQWIASSLPTFALSVLKFWAHVFLVLSDLIPFSVCSTCCCKQFHVFFEFLWAAVSSCSNQTAVIHSAPSNACTVPRTPNVALGNQAFNHLSMGRRWMKLLVLALTVSHLSHQLLCIGFLGTSNVGDAQIRSRKIVRAASPVPDGLGVVSAVASLTDFFFRGLDCYKKNLKQVKALEQFGDVDNHANKLFQKIKGSRSVIVPSL